MIDFLVVQSHPDDEVAVSGILAKAKKEGKKTAIICLTNGAASGFATEETRQKEMKEAAKVLNLDLLHHLDYSDSDLEFNSETVEKVAALLKEIHPQVILTIHPQDYHPDHLACSHITDKALFVAGLKRQEEPSTWHPKQVLYFSLDPRTNPQRPDLIIDISDVIETKVAVAASHPSQIEHPAFVKERARQTGGLGGFEYGEGLYIRQPLRLDRVAPLLSKNKIGR